jgi:hypothetical protein
LRPVTPYTDKVIDYFCGVSGAAETIPAYEAILMLTDAQPNSYENTAINLADNARLIPLHAWGRPIPKMEIPDHIPTPDPIPPDIWAYAMIDPFGVNGPNPRSKMKYRRPYAKPYIEDDRVLYDAVNFNKREVMELCREARILVSKRQGNQVNWINSARSILRKLTNDLRRYWRQWLEGRH